MIDRTELAIKLLEAAGWFPGRKVNLTQVEHAFKVRGFCWTPSIERFLEEFNNIQLIDPRCNYSQNVFEINVEESMVWKRQELQIVKQIERYYQRKFVRIGFSELHDLQIFLSGTGEIGECDFQLTSLGISWNLQGFNDVLNRVARVWAMQVEN